MMWEARVNAICARAHGTGFAARIGPVSTPTSAVIPTVRGLASVPHNPDPGTLDITRTG